jgi:hypothetical protein
MAKKFPEMPRAELTPDGSPVPNPRKKFSSEHSVSSSVSANVGHEDYSDRMSHPFRDGFEPNDESGEGLN